MKTMVTDILKRLGKSLLEVAKHPVAIEERMQPILSVLEHTQVIGLYGMGGIGKTTLAKALLNRLRSDFDSCCFLEVGKGADSNKLQQLQQQALADLCELDSQHVPSTAEGLAKLKKRLASGKKLLVIDDVWSEEQRDAFLVGMDTGSRVIITTRSQNILRCPGVQQCLEVDLLSAAHSLMLLSWHAFLSPSPPLSLPGMADLVANACAGLPLTLEVVGSYLYKVDEVDTWNDALVCLQSGEALNGTEDDRLFARLRLSYDALQVRLKDRFLDVACMMRGMDVATALCIWGIRSTHDLNVLCSLSLLRVHNGRLTMHDQLTAMGRSLVLRRDREVEYDQYVWDTATALEKLEHCKVWPKMQRDNLICFKVVDRVAQTCLTSCVGCRPETIQDFREWSFEIACGK